MPNSISEETKVFFGWACGVDCAETERGDNACSSIAAVECLNVRSSREEEELEDYRLLVF